VRIEAGAEAGDVALADEAAEAVAHRGGRQADALGELGIGDAAVALELSQDAAVGLIKVCHVYDELS